MSKELWRANLCKKMTQKNLFFILFENQKSRKWDCTTNWKKRPIKPFTIRGTYNVVLLPHIEAFDQFIKPSTEF